MTPEQYCQNKAAPAGSSLHYSFLFLQPDQRRAATAIYALREEIDKIADGDPAVAPIRLAWWRSEMAAALAGRAQHPVGRALAPAIGRYQLPAAALDEMLLAGECEVAKTRFARYDALRDYCRLAGGAPAKLAAIIFGYRDPSTLAAAIELGGNLRLADIVAEIGGDAARGRLYLPTQELGEFDVRVGDIFHRNLGDNVRHLMRFQLTRANEALRDAIAHIPATDRRAQRPHLIRGALTLALLDELADDPCAVLRERIELTPLRKLWIAWKTRA